MDQLLPLVNNTRLVACHCAGLCSPVLDLICGRVERHRGFSGFGIGNQGIFKGTCLNICGFRGGLVETNQKPPRSTQVRGRSYDIESTHINNTIKERELE